VNSSASRGRPPQPRRAAPAALRHYDEVTLSDHLRIALSSRSVIDHAIGIIMAQLRGTPEQAFAALRTIPHRRNIKLRVVAAELVETIRPFPTRHQHRASAQAVPPVGDSRHPPETGYVQRWLDHQPSRQTCPDSGGTPHCSNPGLPGPREGAADASTDRLPRYRPVGVS
jgi:ANTAR domain-containing protein